ncbi:MAG: hybrid sensor histidine kinase/response regulator [Phenylobacterium sp.]
MTRHVAPTASPKAAASPEGAATPVTIEELAGLSHEFRTPLNGVLGLARLLEATPLTGEQRSYVDALRESGEHLLGLVNQLLDFARLGASAVEVLADEVALEDLLRGVCELTAPRAAEKGLEIGWWIAPGLGRIRADEGRLRQVLLNYVGNAIKFTRRGGVLVSAAPAGTGRIRLSVCDTGPGVSEAERERIFEPFVQTDPRVDGVSLGGAGLGLAIVRSLAAAMRGAAGVSPAPGGGADFWLELPAPRAGGAAGRNLARRRIGVVSPSPVVCEAAVRQIASRGGEGVAASRVSELPADAEVLLVDHALSPAGPPDDRPAIILLSPEERGLIDGYRARGFAGYLIKPLRPASLAERVLAAAGGRSRAERLDDRIAPAAAPGLKVLLVEDHAINALLATAMLNRESCVVDHAAGGPEALAAVAVGAYDLILMDMRMPGMTGPDTAQEMRAQGISTPIVALTANAFEDDRQTCLAAGMDEFLVKPLGADALRRILTRVARGWSEPPGRRRPA